MADKSCDDVIRIRVDMAAAVADFTEQLAAQAADGVTEAPANPANRAVFRALAPFRLVEYGYIEADLPAIEGVYVGFADGHLFSASEDIPEPVVDALVAGDPASMAPAYLYIVLERPVGLGCVDRFLKALSSHLGQPLVGIFRDEAGRMTAQAYDGDRHASDSADHARLAAQVTASVLEANLHLDKARVLKRFAKRHVSADGHAYAQLIYRFASHVVEFSSVAARDDFIAWSRTLCEWIYARWTSWEDMGFGEILRPAETVSAPADDRVAARLLPPSAVNGGAPWHAFGGQDAETALHFTQSDASISDESMRQSLDLARSYWRYVTDAIAAAETLARNRAALHGRRSIRN